MGRINPGASPLSRGLSFSILGLVLAAFAAVLAFDLTSSHRREYEAVRRDSDNLAQLIERQIQTAVEKIDIVLRQNAQGFAPVLAGKQSRNRRDANRELQRWMAHTPEVQKESLRVIDRDGNVVFNAGDTEAIPNVHVGDRAYFLKQKNNAVDQLIISEPLLSRFTGKWLVTLSRPILDENGKFLGVVQMALRTEYFQALFAKIDVGRQGNVSLFDNDWRLLSRHPALPDQLGRQFASPSRDIALAGQSPHTYEAPSRVDGTVRLFLARKLEGLPYVLVIGRAPAEFMYGWRIKAGLYAAGLIALALALGFLLQIYQRYSEHNRRLITEAFEASGEAIVVTDAQGHLISANEAFTTITGYSVEETSGHSIVDLLRSEHHDEAFYDSMARTIENDGVWRGEIWHRLKSGESQPHLLVISTLRNSEGQITNSIGLFSDISALHQARLQAEAANRTKGAFLAVMSHEIRTPLNGILGMAQLLQYPELKAEEVQEYARTILSSGHTLLTLLNDILDLSKVEAGKLELKTAPFEPAALMNDLYALFREAAAEKALVLEVNWQGEGEQAYVGDAIRLRQILSNLMSNAIKFTPKGWVRVEGRELNHDAAEATLEFRVTDSGIGIPREKQGELFKPFSQIDDSNTRQFGGTGLGLSIVRSLAELMGGEVECISMPGQHTCFRVTLRVRHLGADEHPAVPLAVRADKTTPDTTVPHQVLLVEDNPINQRVIAAMLQRLGCSVRGLENGQQAVEAICNQHDIPTLVIMDCQTPVLDGLEATRLIRAWETWQERPRLPIIALTAGAFEADRQRCLAAGMDDFLTKPANVEALREVLQRYPVST